MVQEDECAEEEQRWYGRRAQDEAPIYEGGGALKKNSMGNDDGEYDLSWSNPVQIHRTRPNWAVNTRSQDLTQHTNAATCRRSPPMTVFHKKKKSYRNPRGSVRHRRFVPTSRPWNTTTGKRCFFFRLETSSHRSSTSIVILPKNAIFSLPRKRGRARLHPGSLAVILADRVMVFLFDLGSIAGSSMVNQLSRGGMLSSCSMKWMRMGAWHLRSHLQFFS